MCPASHFGFLKFRRLASSMCASVRACVWVVRALSPMTGPGTCFSPPVHHGQAPMAHRQPGSPSTSNSVKGLAPQRRGLFLVLTKVSCIPSVALPQMHPPLLSLAFCPLPLLVPSSSGAFRRYSSSLPPRLPQGVRSGSAGDPAHSGSTAPLPEGVEFTSTLSLEPEPPSLL